jgi:hypothetical protein
VGLLVFAPQLPQVTNGTVVPAGAGIERAVAAAAASAEPSWVAWKVTPVGGRSQSCCWYSNNDDRWYGCGLEPREEGAAAAPRPQPPSGPVPLEGGTTLLVMARVAGGSVERVRMFSDDCPLDAGGRTIRMVDNVAAEESVAWLSGLVATSAPPAGRSGRSPIINNAIAAIASTDGAAADAALEKLTALSQPAAVRRQAAFWLGQSRGAAGLATLRAMLPRETAPDVRRGIIHAISQSDAPDAVPALLAIAKADKDPALRGEALFWLAQSARRGVGAEITAAIENDPDTKVQERAVMALSQLPKDEGVPLLINVARTHKNAKVRERAMFWLGQSKDPRALQFFETILIKTP